MFALQEIMIPVGSHSQSGYIRRLMMRIHACCVVRCVQGLDALDAGTPVVEAVSLAVKELEVMGWMQSV